MMAIFGALIDRKLAEDVGAARRWLEEHEGSADEAIGMLVDRLVALHRDARPLYRVMLPLVAKGESIGLVAARASNLGTAIIRIDGREAATVNLHRSPSGVPYCWPE